MQNYSIALNATETSLNSQGSAMSENEKYMQSLEAKIQNENSLGNPISRIRERSHLRFYYWTNHSTRFSCKWICLGR